MNVARRYAKAIGVLALCAVLASGCASGKIIIAREGTPMRLATETQAQVMVFQNGTWVRVNETARIPPGWYVVPPRFVRPEDFK